METCTRDESTTLCDVVVDGITINFIKLNQFSPICCLASVMNKYVVSSPPCHFLNIILIELAFTSYLRTISNLARLDYVDRLSPTIMVVD